MSEEYERELIRYQLDQLLAELSSITETRQREIVQRFSELPVEVLLGHDGFMHWYSSFKARMDELGVLKHPLLDKVEPRRRGARKG